MQTLSRGYKKPDTGDRGSVFFPALESNIVRVNSHSHDGVNSELLSASLIQKGLQTILNTNWGADLGGSTYVQTVTLPTGWVFDNAVMSFYISGTGVRIWPSIVKLTTTTYSVEVNDNTLTLTATYA
jgi:hypothetical protein